MSFPTLYREVRRLTLETVLETELARRVARKAGIRLGGTAEALNIWGTFSEINHDTLGFQANLLADASYLFPDDTERMSRYAPMRASACRLLVTVTGAAEATLGIEGDEITFSAPVSAPLNEVGVHLTDWTPISVSREAPYIRWVVTNPSLATSAYGLGLCQLQVR